MDGKVDLRMMRTVLNLCQNHEDLHAKVSASVSSLCSGALCLRSCCDEALRVGIGKSVATTGRSMQG